ncbi:LuxR C-terminal-related transcriptional regulator [Streptomyces sp. NPDC054802]
MVQNPGDRGVEGGPVALKALPFRCGENRHGAAAGCFREALFEQFHRFLATSRILREADWDVRVLILTTFDPDEYVYEALRAGAGAFVLKDIPPEQLATAVHTVAEGGALLAPSITWRLIDQFAERRVVNTTVAGRLKRLTGREREIVVAVARGASNSEIAEQLFIGAATVKSHVSSILTKLGLRDRIQIVIFSYESGLVEAGDHDVGH